MTFPFTRFRPLALAFAAAALLLLLLALLAAPAAQAGKRERHRAGMPPAALLPAYAQECSGCHLAYPPGLLPGASWRRIMAGLERHYGDDASTDAATARQIGDWLQSQTGRRAFSLAPPQDRITRSPWFERKHRRIAPADWQRPEIKSAANCAACHARAEQGDWRKRNVRLPEGLALQPRHGWRD
jgi:cytochrome c553